MKRQFIEKSESILRSIEGQSIKSCFRLFSESDFEEIPEDKKEQEADGNMYLVFSNGVIVGFYPVSESFTIELEKLEQSELPDGLSDVSGNQFWQKRTGQKILNVELLYAVIDVPFGVRFNLENGLKVELQYASESDYTFDALIVK